MVETSTVIDAYQAHFDELDRAGSPRQSEELRRLRREALERFLQLGFPSTRLEEWRNTNVEPIARTGFVPATDSDPVDPPAIEPFRLPGSLSAVVVNGRFRPDLSRLEGLPQGVAVASLADVLENAPEQVLPHLARYADYREHAFVALNTAFLSDGIFVSVPPSVVVDRPIHLLYLSSPANCQLPLPTATVSHPRTLVVAGEHSQFTVVEHYIGQGERSAFTNPVTEIVAGPGAVIEHVRVQQEADSTFHIATVQIHQEADSRVDLHAFTTGGGLVRNEVNASLKGEGAEVAMNGLYLVKGRQHVDNHTRIDHVAPRCTSSENYKGILDERGRAVFNGRIMVHPDAQKTDARQTNRNLMLSDQALVNTNPQLEIYADDVKCSHGSTVGQIDEESIFYFLTRGIDRETALRLLIHGFTRELIDKLRDETVRESLDRLVAGWLAGTRLSAGAGGK